MSKPYYRDWSNMRHHKGKSFLAPPALFKAEAALYFPNFFGRTLQRDKKYRDTTSALQGKISVVSVFTSTWAENQAATFVSEKANPKLHEVIKNSNGIAQVVQINIEEETLKYWIIKLFMWSLRRKYSVDQWARYFLVKKSVDDPQKDAMGLLNSKVGYTYLVDGDCKIRWAGSGNSEADENKGLVKGVARLVEDLKTKKVAQKVTAPNASAQTLGARKSVKHISQAAA